MTLSAEEIYDAAAEWAARVDAGSLPADAQDALDRWLEADIRHFGAFAQACALLQPMAPNAALPVIADSRPVSRRRVIIGGAVAASAAALTTGAAFMWRGIGTERYTTGIGELRVIPLDEGSVISLNTNSEIEVRYTKTRRGIRLLHGEALFDVAKDKRRPFVVQAGNTEVRAVGTSFTVCRLPDQPVQVVVREGVVEVTRPGVPVAPVVRMAENMKAEAPVDAPTMARSLDMAEVSRELAWREGRIAFHGETLAAAAAEFARYSDIRIRFGDDEVAHEKITGLFVSADPVGFARAVATSFDLQADIRDREIWLTRKEPTGED